MKEILCIICIGLSNPEVRSDKCDLAKFVMEGPHKQSYLLKKTDSEGAHRLRLLFKETHRKCQQENLK